MKPSILIWGSADIFANYETAIQQAGGRCIFATDAVAKEFQGVLLPGGGDVEAWRYGQRNCACADVDAQRDAVELAWIERYCAEGVPILGICRGLQILNVFFGGTLHQDIVGHSRSTGADRYHKTTVVSSFLAHLYGKNTVVNSAHHQSVDRLGEGLRVVQWAPDGIVEAVEHTRFPVWGVQWHPERLRAGVEGRGIADGAKLFAAFIERCKKDEKNGGRSREPTNF